MQVDSFNSKYCARRIQVQTEYWKELVKFTLYRTLVYSPTSVSVLPSSFRLQVLIPMDTHTSSRRALKLAQEQEVAEDWRRPRGNHLYVSVACRSVCEHDQVFCLEKSVLDRLIVPFWGFWSLDFQGSKVTLLPHVLDCWFLAVWRSSWSLDWPPKRAWIAWFNFDPGRKHFYTRHISDYPLTAQKRERQSSTCCKNFGRSEKAMGERSC